MRLAVWNLSHWTRTEAQRQQAWETLRTELGADIALVQEAVPPDGVNAVFSPIGSSRQWGSAVVGLTVEVTQVTEARGRYNKETHPLLQTWPGSVAIASATIADTPLTFVSMYGLIDDGYADTTVHRQLSDLVPLLDSSEHDGRIILGGDLNITTQWTGREAHYRDWEAATFARIRSFGLVDCLDLHRPDSGPLEGCGCADGEDCRHIQTQQHSRSKRPWQNDYLFASAPLTGPSVLLDARVHRSPAIGELGDHYPLVAELGL